jgi:hypothetical protein
MFVYQWIRIRMNERIEKFARESGAWHQVYDQKRFMHDHNFDIERFAELIVRDCMDVVDGYTKSRTFNTHYDAVEQIEQLFGIKHNGVES